MNKLIKHEIGFLSSNEYWGRGILIGSIGDRIAVAYFIMGRSKNSRNRYFYEEDKAIMIAPHDMSKVEDPSLIIYYPIKIVGKSLIVTNGDQTDTVEDYMNKGLTFEEALRTRKFEPDEPHFTPRISGLADCKTGNYKLSILKPEIYGGEECERFFYEYEPIDGTARFIHTYAGNDNPLPPFQGEPHIVEIPDNIDELSSSIWNALNEDNKISLCVMTLDRNTGARETRIFNKRMGD